MMRINRPPGVPISKVVIDSIAHDLGISPGDYLISINNQEPEDLIDYRYLVAGELIYLHIGKADGGEFLYEIEKDYDEDPGLIFAPRDAFTLKCCENNCIFCFVDQMPQGMRPSLNIKDDDYRYSFLEGSFITLTNIRPSEWKRIVDLRLSPLYISVHVIDAALRRRLLGNEKAGNIKEQLQCLVDNRLEFHVQVVLIPGINDGFYLEETISTLAGYWPFARSVALVPVGLTAYRQQLYPLKPFTKRQAKHVIRWGEGWQGLLKNSLGYPFVFLADEFYSIAGEMVPERERYDDFPQLENGVGLVRKFLDELQRFPQIKVFERSLTITLATGVSAEAAVRQLALRLQQISGLKVNLEVIINDYFGDTVTVAGLITGRDLVNQLKGKFLGDILFIPESMINEEHDVFLDDLSVAEASKLLGINIEKASGPAAVFERLLSYVKGR